MYPEQLGLVLLTVAVIAVGVYLFVRALAG